ncbi:unnamed protein product [Rotaria sp. Silwood2]|nr:unnamed protein product [Rotaria sp. Silwood2]CAF4010276.1 unnamed protein product [Rotaria sp. Silwood2]
MDGELRSYVPEARLTTIETTSTSSDDHRLTLTTTARENVNKVIEVVNDPIPILLEGSTGVGKSASIIEAAYLCNRSETFVRYNMSSRVSIDDLLGKVSLVVNEETQSTGFKFVDGPFTTAFSKGYWMLFDELNLAQDTVLQAIESALDTRQLTIHNTSSAQNPVVVHRMHKDFRLFATQNPNSGFFKGKREKLSGSFLSRFRPLIFKELPDDEWREIVKDRLSHYFPDEAEGLADQLVLVFNSRVKKELFNKEHKFEETGPYAEISIRELLKWISLLIWQQDHNQWPRDTHGRDAFLSFSAWCIYGARYRQLGRERIQNIITGNCKWPPVAIHSIKYNVNPDRATLSFDEIECPAQVDSTVDRPEIEWTRTFQMANLDQISFTSDVWDKAFQVHSAIHRAILTENFISAHGIYRIDRSWLWEWLVAAARASILFKHEELARRGSAMYQSRFRHLQAKTIVHECFKNVYGLGLNQDSQPSSARAELPYVLTDRALTVLKQVCFNLRIKQPILVTGSEGCGKSDLLLTLAWLYGKRVHQLNITPETEPSSLIGQIIPNDTNDGSRLVWQHGSVTEAYINGEWVLLDNLATAEPSVLERLNPVLEHKPMLTLTERGDVEPQEMDKEYQLVATMTPPNKQQSNAPSGASSELSPALYNRFAVVHMEDIPFDVHSIDQFERDYLKSEQQRLEQEKQNESLSGLTAEAELAESPEAPSLMGDTAKQIEAPNQALYPNNDFNAILSASLLQTDDGYDDSYKPTQMMADASCPGEAFYDDGMPMTASAFYSVDTGYDDGLPMSDGPSDNLTTNVDSNYFVNYHGLQSSEQNSSGLSTETTKTTPIVDSSTISYDDGLDSLPYVHKQETIPQSSIATADSSDLYDDSLPDMAAPNDSSPTTSQFDGFSSAQQLESETAFPESLLNCVDDILDQYRRLFEYKSYSSFAKDPTLQHYFSFFKTNWEKLIAVDFDRTKPIFLFHDGPVTMTGKQGGILFLEDLDLPSQAVIERLNSMLEPSPTFALTEDITSHGDDSENESRGQLDIVLSPQFQIFASVHQDQEHQVLKLSPATRSRFTEILVPSYLEDELEALANGELIKYGTNEEQVSTLVTMMFSLRKTVRAHTEWKLDNDIRILLRWVDFIRNHHRHNDMFNNLFLGARFFYFDQLPMKYHEKLFSDWLTSNEQLFKNCPLKNYSHIFESPKSEHAGIAPELTNSDDTGISKQTPFEVGQGYIALRYTGVRYTCKSGEKTSTLQELEKRFANNVLTPTFLVQIARVFAATSSKTPLLLEGPPGIGKTHVVTQVCKLVNKTCERINMSANTSLDQLIGCIIPRCSNGRRVFEWQDGKVLDALKKKHWILFDELNLAAPEVLEGLTPLFYRGTTEFVVPLTGEKVDATDTLIFATMNPATIGGGRSKLPRSVSNLFSIVQLEDYSEDELRTILDNLFRFEQIDKTIDAEQLDRVYALQKTLKEDVRDGKVGRTGGPYELNLRDLSKFRDVFRGSISNQMHHFKYIKAIGTERNKDAKNSPTDDSFDKSQKTSLSIRKFAQVAYACQFQGKQDFEHTCQLINDTFPIEDQFKEWERDWTIDTSIANVVRIGSIYINTGSEEPVDTSAGLIHTKQTIQQLELLAAACQSKRAILLEGDICSRKSSLVMELAQVTRNRLVVIPLHENFETSDLIGAWLPTTIQTRNDSILDKVDKLFKQIVKMLLLLCMPILSPESNEDIFSTVKSILRDRAMPIGDATAPIDNKENLKYEIDALAQIKELLEPLNKRPQMPSSVKILIYCYIRQADFFTSKLEDLRVKGKSEVGFCFVESEFVEAIRQGWWVLLDNVNSAPPEVLERLNSLTEDNPMLSLYENSGGQILTQEPDGGIHPNFRLFATANLNRVHSNKLSSAFLNRVIRIWLPAMDDDLNLADDLTLTSDLYQLLCAHLATIPAGMQLAELLLITHAKVKQQVKDGLLVYPTDFAVTYRQLDQCVRTILYLVGNQVNPVDASYWSILRSYCSSLSKQEQYLSFVNQLQNTMKTLQLCAMTVFSISDRVNRKQAQWLQDANRIRDVFVEIERGFAEVLFGMVEGASLLKEKFHEAACDLLNLFIDEILLRMYPFDSNLMTIKHMLTTTINDNQPIDIQSVVKSLIEQKIIKSPLDRSREMDSEAIMRYLMEYVKNFQTPLNNVTSLLNTFIQKTSFSDTNQRQEFLERIVLTAQTFANYLSSPSISKFDFATLIPSLANQLIGLIQPILTLKRKLKSYEIFQDVAFVDAKKNFQIHMSENFDSGLIWAFERAHAAPISSGREEMRTLMDDILNKNTGKGSRTPIEDYHLVMQWFGLQWAFESFLTPTIRDTFQKNVCVTLDFIIECETKYCCYKISEKLTAIINAAIQAFPSESSQFESDYVESKTRVNEKELEINECKPKIDKLEMEIENAYSEQAAATVNERLASLKEDLRLRQAEFATIRERHVQYASKRTSTLNKAMEARVSFEIKLKELFVHEDFQFLSRRFQQPDAPKLNQLIQILNNAQENTSLRKTDGTLDVNAMLTTEFGRTLIDNDDILNNPLVLFICGFFFLPFSAPISSLYVISSWNELRDDKIDLRTMKSHEIIFYCPSKSPLDCCLMSISNSVQSIHISLWSLEQNFNVTEVDALLVDILPAKVNRQFEQKSLEKPGNLSDADQQSFGFACLYQFETDPAWIVDSKQSRTSSELYYQVTNIYSELKEFSQNHSAGRKQPTKLTYQNIDRFRVELERVDRRPDWPSIRQLSSVLKSYQSRFSTLAAQNLFKDLTNSIQTIRPENINAQHATLAFIQPLRTKYGCIGTIVEHLRKPIGRDRITLSDQKQTDFQLLFQFIDDSVRLLKLLTQHIVYGNRLIDRRFYEKTPNAIAQLETIFRSTVSLIDLNNGDLYVHVAQPETFFLRLQTELDQILKELEFTPFVSKFGLADFVIRIGPLFEIRSTDTSRRSPSPDRMKRLSTSNVDDRQQERIDGCIKKLEQLLIRAGRMLIRPHDIINQIYSTLAQLQTIDSSKENDAKIRTLLAEEQILTTHFDACAQKMNQQTQFAIELPTPRPIPPIRLENLRLNDPKTATFDKKDEFSTLQSQHQSERVNLGKDQNEIIKQAKEMSARITLDIGKIGQFFAGEDHEHVQRSLHQFQRFISNLLVAGCRYNQIQRGTRDPLDQVLTEITREEIDPRLPHTEFELLKMINTCQTQLKSHCQSLLYQTLHMTFALRTNTFALLDSLDSSIKSVTQLILPSSYMIVQLWHSIDDLAKNIAKAITPDEYDQLRSICDVFIRMADASETLRDEAAFLSDRVNSGIVNDLFEHIEKLSSHLKKNRSQMETFSNELLNRWHVTLKEILRGFIKARKDHVRCWLEYNNRIIKPLHLLLDNRKSNGDLRLADIRRVLEKKQFILATPADQATYLPKLNRVQIYFVLLCGSLDNLENIVMKMSLEPMNYPFLQQLFTTIERFYSEGYAKWRRLTKEAEQILNATRQSANNWMEIQELMKAPLTIEDDVTNAFLHSKMSGDAHIWMRSSNSDILCEPSPALIDFGIALGGIHQRRIQHFIFHNGTGKDVNIQIDRPSDTTNVESIFDATIDSILVEKDDICEVDVLFKSPSQLGSIDDIWDLKVDNRVMSRAIQLHADIVEADIDLGAGAKKIQEETSEYWEIDFGIVACAGEAIMKCVDLKNLLGCELRVKPQLQSTGSITFQSKLTINQEEIVMEPNSTMPFSLTLQPSDNNDEDFEASISFTVSASKNSKWLKAKAKVCRTRLSVAHLHKSLIENTDSELWTGRFPSSCRLQ